MEHKVGDVLTAKQDLIMGNGDRLFTAGKKYEIEEIIMGRHLFTDDDGWGHTLSEQFMENIFGVSTDNSYDYAMGVL